VSSTARGYLSIVFAASLWGIAGTTAKYLFASREVPPFLLVQVRMGLSFLVLLLSLAIAAPALLRIQRRDLPFVAVWGIVGMAMVQFTYLFTISKTNVATAIFLQYLAPILAALYARVVDRERLTGLLVGCLSLAMAGSVLLIFGGTSRLMISPEGLASGLASAVFMAFYTIFGGKAVGRLSPWTLLCYGLGFGWAFWMAVDLALLATGREVPGVALLAQPSLWLFFGYIAILATVIPFGLYLSGLRWVSPTQATITGMLEPVVGGLAAYLFLSESLRPAQIAGGLCILVAVILLQMRRQEGAPAQQEAS
jgi:drug/metabolite transporter (DMT)-like permease